MSISSAKPYSATTDEASISHTTALTAQHAKQIAVLEAQIKELESELLKSRITEDVGFKMAEKVNQYSAGVEKRNQWLGERNSQLENPKGSHYPSLSWPGKIIFCIKKLKRPLRFQEIMQELNIMEQLHKTESWLTEKTISVTLSGMAKDGRLYSEKMRGTRGNFYALLEWLNDERKLSDKMRQRIW